MKYPENVINRAFRNARLIIIILHLWQHIMTMLIIMKLKKSGKFNDIQSDCLRMYSKVVT